MQRPTEGHDALRQRVFAGRERRSAQRRRKAVARKGGRRAIAIGAGIATVAAVLTVSQLASSAQDEDPDQAAGECTDQATVTVEEVEGNDDVELHVEEDADGFQHFHYRRKGWPRPDPTEAPAPDPTASPAPGDCEDPGSGGEDPGGEDPGGEDPGGEDPGGEDPGGEDPGGEDPGSGGDGVGTVPPLGDLGDDNGLDLLGRDCTVSDLPIANGFQTEEAVCVQTQAGEASAAANNPSLLISESPEWVEVDQPFTLTISTRNIVRNRFLGAGAGGYYAEASYLNDDGIQQGHYHCAIVNLVEGNVAPSPEILLSPQFFAAQEDGGGGAGLDETTVEVPGLPEAGLYRAMCWGGDPSHRVPMMSFARQQIMVDTVRITVTEVGEGGGEEG